MGLQNGFKYSENTQQAAIHMLREHLENIQNQNGTKRIFRRV